MAKMKAKRSPMHWNLYIVSGRGHMVSQTKLDCEREREGASACGATGRVCGMNRFMKDACEIDDGSTDQQNPLKTNDASKMLSQINKNKIPRMKPTNHDEYLMEQATTTRKIK